MAWVSLHLLLFMDFSPPFLWMCSWLLCNHLQFLILLHSVWKFNLVFCLLWKILSSVWPIALTVIGVTCLFPLVIKFGLVQNIYHWGLVVENWVHFGLDLMLYWVRLAKLHISWIFLFLGTSIMYFMYLSWSRVLVLLIGKNRLKYWASRSMSVRARTSIPKCWYRSLLSRFFARKLHLYYFSYPHGSAV